MKIAHALQRLILVVVLACFLVPANTQAQSTCGNGVDALGFDCVEESGLTQKDPRQIVGEIIQIALSLTGALMVGLIAYAGFIYMTSQGREDMIDKSMTIMRGAVIGLIIILSAYAITTFVFENAVPATSNTIFIAP